MRAYGAYPLLGRVFRPRTTHTSRDVGRHSGTIYDHTEQKLRAVACLSAELFGPGRCASYKYTSVHSASFGFYRSDISSIFAIIKFEHNERAREHKLQPNSKSY